MSFCIQCMCLWTNESVLCSCLSQFFSMHSYSLHHRHQLLYHNNKCSSRSSNNNKKDYYSLSLLNSLLLLFTPFCMVHNIKCVSVLYVFRIFLYTQNPETKTTTNETNLPFALFFSITSQTNKPIHYQPLHHTRDRHTHTHFFNKKNFLGVFLYMYVIIINIIFTIMVNYKLMCFDYNYNHI